MDGFTTHLAQIMIKHYFHFEAKITFGGVIINKFLHVSPLASYLGFEMAEHLENKWHFSLSSDDYFRFINFFMTFLLQIPIPIRKKRILVTSGAGLAYSAFIARQIAREFDAYIEKCKELSLYDTGVSAEYGDKLITLSTCEYSRTNGRIVVVAKKVTESSGANAPANDGAAEIPS